MTGPLAFRAAYSDWKLVKTRGVIQVVFEVPLADSNAAYDVLGGMPDAAREGWFAIAPLAKEVAAIEPKQIKDKREWRDLSPQQQAGMRCEEAPFATFLQQNHPDDWRETPDAADCVRLICGIESRSELASNHKARVIWHQLDDEYQAWRLI
jgi:hypothetical protein